MYRSTMYIYTHRLAIISNSFKINSITCFNMHPEAAWPITINNFKTKIYIWVLEKFCHSLNTFSHTDLGNVVFKISFHFICVWHSCIILNLIVEKLVHKTIRVMNKYCNNNCFYLISIIIVLTCPIQVHISLLM